MKRFTVYCTALVCLWPALLAEAASSVTGDPLQGRGRVQRMLLTRAALFSSAAPSGPVEDSAFAVPADAAQPTEAFEGTLHLSNVASSDGYRNIVDVWDYRKNNPDVQHLPEFNFVFVQNGSHLIPVRQGLVITGSKAWNLIVGPGRVWREDADDGYMRASFPFTLVERNQNCTHNGAMMFLFSAQKTPNVSPVVYQVTEETCDYLRFDMWGKAPAAYTPSEITGAEELRNAHAAEVAHRMPTKQLTALAVDYPAAGIQVQNFIKAYKHPESVGTYGVVVNGVNYNRGCPTRHGTYAFCTDMRMASYSTAKSVFAGVSMMRLGQLYGGKVYDLLVRDYVPEYTQGGDWTGVTFKDALGMATGNYISKRYMADEDGKVMGEFLLAEKYEDKMHDAIAPFPHAASPGTQWVYQSSATFIVTQAMNAYLKKKQGPDADLFRAWVNDVAKPLNTSRGFWSTIRTDNSESGAPTGYYGLFWSIDDVGKITTMLNRDHGTIDGRQVLDPSSLDEAIFRTSRNVGLDVSGVPLYGRGDEPVPGTWRYNTAFWAKHVIPAEFPQFKCGFWTSLMFGYGGIVIALFPNQTTFYLFSDANEVHWYEAMTELSKITPMCRLNAESASGQK